MEFEELLAWEERVRQNQNRMASLRSGPKLQSHIKLLIIISLTMVEVIRKEYWRRYIAWPLQASVTMGSASASATLQGQVSTWNADDEE